MKKMIEPLHGIHTGTRKVDDPKAPADDYTPSTVAMGHACARRG